MFDSTRTPVVAAAAAFVLGASILWAQPPAGAPAGGAVPAGGGAGGGFARTMRPPASYDFSDNTGFTSLFDGSLKGWDYDTNLWDIKDGAIHIAASCEKPTGTVYAVSSAGEFGDFILKYELKGTGNINGGMQFRSYVSSDPAATGTKYPPRAPRPAGGAPGAAGAAAGGAARAGGGPGGAPGAGAPAGPPRQPACANPGTPPSRESEAKWDLFGPQADFDRNNNFSAMNYEQGGRGIMATPGYSLVAEPGSVKSAAQVATKEQLDSWFHKDDWNQFMIVAIGHSTSIYMNGHLVTELLDLDPKYFRSSGKIGIESESTGDLWARNINIKKLD